MRHREKASQLYSHHESRKCQVLVPFWMQRCESGRITFKDSRAAPSSSSTGYNSKKHIAGRKTVQINRVFCLQQTYIWGMSPPHRSFVVYQ